MGFASATVYDKYEVRIDIPANPTSIVLTPKTSGTTSWINYCKWAVGNPPVQLGEWYAHKKTLTILSNPKKVINKITKHGTLTTSTSPAIVSGYTMTLQFTHKKNILSPIKNDSVKATITQVTGTNITVINILAEDGYDKNYLDFQMAVVVQTS